jgi:putative endonuclease
MAAAFSTSESAFSTNESGTEGRRRLGRRGEEAAAQWYSGAGYTVVDRNWRCSAGEIDLVALEPGGSVVVICEVKTRSSTSFGSPAEAVTVAKQRRLRRLAALWLAGQRTAGPPRPTVRAVRFDVAAVMADRTGELVVDVVEDAF